LQRPKIQNYHGPSSLRNPDKIKPAIDDDEKQFVFLNLQRYNSYPTGSSPTEDPTRKGKRTMQPPSSATLNSFSGILLTSVTLNSKRRQFIAGHEQRKNTSRNSKRQRETAREPNTASEPKRRRKKKKEKEKEKSGHDQPCFASLPFHPSDTPPMEQAWTATGSTRRIEGRNREKGG